MDTKTFLQTILPSRGIKYVMRLVPRPNHPKGDATVHHIAPDSEEVADLVLDLDRKYTKQNIYFAMASYKEAQYRTITKDNGDEFTYVVGRTQQNALNVKSLWMDWDVGKDSPDSYGSREDALAALKVYLKATGLPAPLIISSGYGIHTYWVFTEEVPADVWASVASLQRVIMRHLGVKFDPSRDKDCASVLRPPGTHNRKAGKDDVLVKVVKGEVNALPAQEYKRRLMGYIDEHKLTVQVKTAAPIWAAGTGNLGELTSDFAPSYARIIAQHCNQVRSFSETGGASEPLWYAALGVLKHCEDGEQKAHEWSSRHADYDQDNTQSKYEQWAAGPTTCQRFRELNASGCDGCQHQCKSPIQLGHDEVLELPNIREMAEEVTERATLIDTAKEDSLDDGIPLGWPAGFGFDKSGDRITMKIQDANGVWQDIKIATPLFYPVEQIRDEDGTYKFRIHMWVRGRVREFYLQTKHTADPKSLKIHLHANQVHVLNDKAVASYMSHFMSSMQKLQEETDTYRQMGWKHDFQGWLVGDTLITEKETRKVALSTKFSTERKGLYDPKGDPAQWTHTVNKLFNVEHGEPYQFAICAAFAAPLHDLLGFSEWRGIPFALTTNESGYGKTTVNLIANSIWYDPEKGKISNATAKGVLGIASEFNNLPFLLDEVTSYLSDPKDMGDLLYAMSNGRGREGMTSGGTLRDNSPPWTGACSITGNRNILLQVTENKLNPEAMQMRVFEIDLDTYPRIAAMDKGSRDYEKHNQENRLLAQTLVSNCSGVIGTDYIRYIMKNTDEVRRMLRKVSVGLAKHMDGDATKERFYYHLITTVLVGGYYARKLGYIDFDLNNLKKWCIAHVARLRGAVKESRRTPQDHFASMMADFVGRIIITKRFASLDARKNKVEPHLGGALRSGIAGRYILGDDKERTQLYITISAIQQWCVENGLSYNTVRRELIRDGLVRLATKETNRDTGAVRISIGKGVIDVHDLGKPYCLEFDADRAAGILPATIPAKVIDLDLELTEKSA